MSKPNDYVTAWIGGRKVLTTRTQLMKECVKLSQADIFETPAQRKRRVTLYRRNVEIYNTNYNVTA